MLCCSLPRSEQLRYAFKYLLMDSFMLKYARLLLIGLLILTMNQSFSHRAGRYSGCDNCCENMGGVQYCDSSVGRYVCRNGDYSVCYCTRHAIMDLQKLQGCCLWQGGVFKINERGIVICNSGDISEICSLQSPVDTVNVY